MQLEPNTARPVAIPVAEHVRSYLLSSIERIKGPFHLASIRKT